MQQAPTINIGLMTEKAVSFSLQGEWVNTQNGQFISGDQLVFGGNERVLFEGKSYHEILFEPFSKDAYFELKAVVVGKNFHWEHRKDQLYTGALYLKATEEGILVINQIDIETYLSSVISSEMSSSASSEFLKAHAVISRSWLFAQLEKSLLSSKEDSDKYPSFVVDKTQLIRWYDREEHKEYDVCNTDHCQRYEGVTVPINEKAKMAVYNTRGEVLTYKGKVCDARFSKCCGGATELFENTWEPVHHDYLLGVRDAKESDLPDLTVEENADQWIRTTPPSFCGEATEEILDQVLVNYDKETKDFYRWTVEYEQKELVDLIKKKTNIHFGEILDLVPIERGTSGRIIKLKIVGKNNSYIIGKELEIRKVLSESHLYSSAFVCDKLDIVKGIPQRFRLTGAGWGHGVGFCQIGAAVMGEKGHKYEYILNHYYKGANIKKKY